MQWETAAAKPAKSRLSTNRRQNECARKWLYIQVLCFFTCMRLARQYNEQELAAAFRLPASLRYNGSTTVLAKTISRLTKRILVIFCVTGWRSWVKLELSITLLADPVPAVRIKMTKAFSKLSN